MKNFRTVMYGINVRPLLDQIAGHPELWNTNSVRTSKEATVHYDVDDIILRFPGPYEQWNEAPFNVLTEAQSIVFGLAGQVWCECLGRVVISRLPPGKQIPPHEDRIRGRATLPFRRYQVPLCSHDGVLFHCAGETMHMIPGNAYWFANTLTHSVINDSQEDRLSMIVDIRPFSPCD